MEVFDNTVFKLNPNLTWETIDTPIAKVTIIDNFYEDLSLVNREIAKLPGAATVCNTPGDVLDYRKSYAGNMGGTELPYPDDVSRLVAEIIGYRGHLATNEAVMVNCNKIISDRYKDNWYNVHQDPTPSEEWTDRISTVVMLNEHYDEDEGTNFFYDKPTVDDGIWSKKSENKKAFTLQAKPNRAILFSPYIWHGAAYGGEQFKHEFRYTQVIFTNLR